MYSAVIWAWSISLLVFSLGEVGDCRWQHADALSLQRKHHSYLGVIHTGGVLGCVGGPMDHRINSNDGSAPAALQEVHVFLRDNSDLGVL